MEFYSDLMGCIVISWDMNGMYPLVMTNIAIENVHWNSGYCPLNLVISIAIITRGYQWWCWDHNTPLMCFFSPLPAVMWDRHPWHDHCRDGWFLALPHSKNLFSLGWPWHPCSGIWWNPTASHVGLLAIFSPQILRAEIRGSLGTIPKWCTTINCTCLAIHHIESRSKNPLPLFIIFIISTAHSSPQSTTPISVETRKTEKKNQC